MELKVNVNMRKTGNKNQMVLNVNCIEKAHLGIVLKAKQIIKERITVSLFKFLRTSECHSLQRINGITW